MSLIGYARVSSEDQCLDSQIDALRAAGCERIYSEKASGKSAKNRDQLAALLADLSEGDTVLFVRLDRLARSTLDLLNTLDTITAKGAGYKCLTQPLFDTSSAMARLMVTVLGAFAEFERTLILERTAAGLKRAHAAGIKSGRKPKYSEVDYATACARIASGARTRDVAREMKVTEKTLRDAKKRLAA